METLINLSLALAFCFVIKLISKVIIDLVELIKNKES
jgi:hypothetical protein